MVLMEHCTDIGVSARSGGNDTARSQHLALENSTLWELQLWVFTAAVLDTTRFSCTNYHINRAFPPPKRFPPPNHLFGLEAFARGFQPWVDRF